MYVLAHKHTHPYVYRMVKEREESMKSSRINPEQLQELQREQNRREEIEKKEREERARHRMEEFKQREIEDVGGVTTAQELL